jgi:hypothetical protein
MKKESAEGIGRVAPIKKNGAPEGELLLNFIPIQWLLVVLS